MVKFKTKFPIPRRESGEVEKNNGMNSFIARMATHALLGYLSILKSESAIDLVKSRTFKKRRHSDPETKLKISSFS